VHIKVVNSQNMLISLKFRILSKKLCCLIYKIISLWNAKSSFHETLHQVKLDKIYKDGCRINEEHFTLQKMYRKLSKP